MRVVQPRDVHARLDEAGEHLGLARGGTDRGDDLRAAHLPRTLVGGADRGRRPCHGAFTSGKCSAQCSRSRSRSHARSAGDATRSRASSSRWRVIGGAPAIVQLTASRSKRNSKRAVPGVLAAGRRGEVLAAGDAARRRRASPGSARRAARARRPRRRRTRCRARAARVRAVGPRASASPRGLDRRASRPAAAGRRARSARRPSRPGGRCRSRTRRRSQRQPETRSRASRRGKRSRSPSRS